VAPDRPRPPHPIRMATVASFRSDGERLATTGPNGNLKIWDTTNARQPVLLTRLTGRHRIIGTAWNPVAVDLLATLSTDSSVTIWRLTHDQTPRGLVKLIPRYECAGSIEWFKDGRHIALAGDDGSVNIWNTASLAGRTECVGDSSLCLSAYAGLDDVLHMVYDDGSIRRRALAEQSRPLRARHLRPVAGAAWSATGAALAVARHDGRVEIRSPDLNLIRTVDTVTGDVPLIAWNGDAEVLLVDQHARRLTVLHTSGHLVEERQLEVTPTSVSAANGVVAIGCLGFAPIISRI
jgi:WD40 repeat protein